ncbi:hypothetical protein LZ30DRAFT_336327 [Colletotrichum cereale]|nr:hypothetical protein LZ30DRAFT_336327 [Colletotrichum cereale]
MMCSSVASFFLRWPFAATKDVSCSWPVPYVVECPRCLSHPVSCCNPGTTCFSRRMTPGTRIRCGRAKEPPASATGPQRHCRVLSAAVCGRRACRLDGRPYRSPSPLSLLADTSRMRPDGCYGKACVTSIPSRPQSLAKTPVRSQIAFQKARF